VRTNNPTREPKHRQHEFIVYVDENGTVVEVEGIYRLKGLRACRQTPVRRKSRTKIQTVIQQPVEGQATHQR
jgi:hypothetical protein